MESPYKEILIFVFGGGLITAVIQGAKAIGERMDKKKEEKAKKEAAHITNSVELQRIADEGDEAAFRRLASALEASQREEERLRGELEKARNTSSLSGATITAMYKAYRDLGITISRLDMLIASMPLTENLSNAIENLKRRYDDLGEKLP